MPKIKQFIWFLLSISTLVNVGSVARASNEEHSALTHRIKDSENLTEIRNDCCNESVSVRSIAHFNAIKNPNLVQPGKVIRFKEEWLKSKLLPIKVIVFSGDVTLLKASADKPEVFTLGHVLKEGDTITTGENSLVKLRFADDSVVNLQPNATMRIAASHQRIHSGEMQIMVHLKQGRTEVLANPEHKADRQFKVKTPSAVAVVRGTNFRVGADSGKTLEETLDGKVDLAVLKDRVSVEKGFGSLAQAGQAPLPPIALPPEPDQSQFNHLFEFSPIEFELRPHQDVVAVTAQLSQSHDFSQLLSTHRVETQPNEKSVLKVGELADGEYFMRLRSENDKGLQSADIIHAFTVDVFPRPPEALLSVEQTLRPEVGWPLQWTSINGAKEYILQLAKEEGFSTVIYERSTFYTSFYLTTELAKRANYWRVGIRSNGQSIKFSKPIALDSKPIN